MSSMPGSNCGNRNQTCQWSIDPLGINIVWMFYLVAWVSKNYCFKRRQINVWIWGSFWWTCCYCDAIIEIFLVVEPVQRSMVRLWYVWVSRGRSAHPGRGRIPPSQLHSPDTLGPLKQPTQIENKFNFEPVFLFSFIESDLQLTKTQM